MASHSGIRQVFQVLFSRASQRRRSVAVRSRGFEDLETRFVLAPVVPAFSSLPGAPVTVYLDFDGHTESQDWPAARSDGQSGAIVTPVFDIDNDQTTFSAAELDVIKESYLRTAEDFAPFRVNVTTVDPGSYNDFETMRVSIGGNGSWIGSPGGIAWLGSFNNGLVNTCYVFSDNVGFGASQAKGIAMAASHEVGHTMNLLHHSIYDSNGNQTSAYDPGRPDLGPIMGAPYGSERETWASAPDSNGPNSIQDDLAVLTGASNRTVKFRADDYGNTVAQATPYQVTSSNLQLSGIISQNNDVDIVRFETDAGNIAFTMTGLNLKTIMGNNNITFGTNLDAVLSLLDSSGNVIATSNPTNSLFASVSATVPQGIYYLAMSNTGQYGALGQYTVTGNVFPLPAVPVMLAPTGVSSDPLTFFSWTIASNVVEYELQVDRYDAVTDTWISFFNTKTANNTYTSQFQYPEQSYRARVRTIGINNTISAWSNYVTFSVDVPSPGTPAMIRPIGEIGLSLPTFEWTKPANAASYELLVNNVDTGERVIYKTNYIGTSYVHFTPLRDGNYTAEVRASNAIGEFSSWSRRVDFTIKAPIPTAPVLKSPSVLTPNQNPRFTWDLIESAAYYDLWVNNKTTGKTQYLRKTDISGSASFYDPPFFDQGVYVAWLRGVNGNDVAGPWSAPRTFTVDVPVPGTPELTGPVNADKTTLITSLNPTFTWKPAARAARYELWANNTTTGQLQIIRRSDITETQFTSLANLTQGSYRCWVRAINSANEVGPWSNVYTFTIDEPTPQMPVITGPAINPAGSVDNANPTFTWSTSINAPFYQFLLYEVNPKTGQMSIYINQFGLTDKSYTIPFDKRLKEQTYVARVRAYNVSGDYSNWSSDYRVRIDVPDPVTPLLRGPSGTLNDNTPLFVWTHDKSSFKYELLIRDLERNENIVIQVSSFGLAPDGNLANYLLPNDKALRNSTYRYWVRAFNSMGQAGGWSTAGTFVIRVTASEKAPAKPLEVLPQQQLLAALPQQTAATVDDSVVRPITVSEPVEPPVAAPVKPVAVVVVPATETAAPAAQALEQQLIDEALWRIVNPAAMIQS